MSRFDSLFARTAGPMLQSHMGLRGCAKAIRLVKGSEQARHTVEGCIFIRDNQEAGRVAAEAGYIVDTEGERFIELALLEVPVAQPVDSRDQWIAGDETWEAHGFATGRDATFKTIVLKRTIREGTGPNNGRAR